MRGEGDSVTLEGDFSLPWTRGLHLLSPFLHRPQGVPIQLHLKKTFFFFFFGSDRPENGSYLFWRVLIAN